MVDEARPKLPRATLRNDKLYVEGEKEPYFRDQKETIWLRVTALTVHRGYGPSDYEDLTSEKALTERINGIAKFEEGDRLAVIGLETDRTTPIQFLLLPVSDTETKFHWHAKIWFSPRYDWKVRFARVLPDRGFLHETVFRRFARSSSKGSRRQHPRRHANDDVDEGQIFYEPEREPENVARCTANRRGHLDRTRQHLVADLGGKILEGLRRNSAEGHNWSSCPRESTQY
jgi:hypothetical protein